MYGRHEITYIDKLPPLDELENQATRNKDLIERYQPTTNSTPSRITQSPYASSATMYGGDPNLKSNPTPVFPSKTNAQDEFIEKDKLFERASQKIPSRVDGATLAMPAKLGPNSMEKEFEDYGIDMKHHSSSDKRPIISYSQQEYIIPDESFIIYEESNNKMTNTPPPQTRPNWQNKIPSYQSTPTKSRQSTPIKSRQSTPPKSRQSPPPQYPHPPHQYPLPPPHMQYNQMGHPPPIPQYYSGHHHYPQYPPQHQHQHQQSHICSLISTHLAECPLCMRLYVARKQFSYKDDDNKARNINTAIYTIIIIFLIACCVYMFKRMMNKEKSE
jgi:hypothetical protein